MREFFEIINEYKWTTFLLAVFIIAVVTIWSEGRKK